MPIYTFYPSKPDGSAASFQAFDLGSDAAARGRAVELLAQHRSCSHVVVWAGERRVLCVDREAVGA